MTAQQSNTLIGYLTEVRGNGMEARVAKEHSGNFPIITIDGEEMLAGQIGLIPLSDKRVSMCWR